MKKYIEGYYCQDEKYLKALNAETNRKIVDAYRNCYPEKLTPQEIANKVGMGKDDNVSTYVKNLADMFVKKMDKKGSARVRGKPPAGQRYHMKKPAWTYLFEDKNFALNQRDNFDFQFAP